MAAQDLISGVAAALGRLGFRIDEQTNSALIASRRRRLWDAMGTAPYCLVLLRVVDDLTAELLLEDGLELNARLSRAVLRPGAGKLLVKCYMTRRKSSSAVQYSVRFETIEPKQFQLTAMRGPEGLVLPEPPGAWGRAYFPHMRHWALVALGEPGVRAGAEPTSKYGLVLGLTWLFAMILLVFIIGWTAASRLF